MQLKPHQLLDMCLHFLGLHIGVLLEQLLGLGRDLFNLGRVPRQISRENCQCQYPQEMNVTYSSGMFSHGEPLSSLAATDVSLVLLSDMVDNCFGTDEYQTAAGLLQETGKQLSRQVETQNQCYISKEHLPLI